MAYYVVLACFVLVVPLSVIATKPDGVLTLFRTNCEELRHVPMMYESSNPVPTWLEGTLVRNAPAMFELGGRSALHVYDGFGKVHSVAIGQHGMNFSSAFLNTSSYYRSRKANRYAPAVTFFGVEPELDLHETREALTYPYDNTFDNVWRYGHGNTSVYAALTDAWIYAKFDLNTLASIGVSIPQVSGLHLFQLIQSCAHPIAEPGTTNSISYLMIPSLLPGQKQEYYVLRIKTLTDFDILANFQLENASYMHSFTLTENYAVFFAQPAYFDLTTMTESARLSDALRWFNEEKTTIILANIKTGKIETMQTDAIFYFHHANAYETVDGKIVADVCSFEEGLSVIADYKLSQLRNLSTLHGKPSRARLYRYTIDIVSRSVQVQPFRSEIPLQDFFHKIDYPIINENYRARHYCYLYGVVPDFSPSNPLYGSFALVKKNLCAPGEDQFWYHPSHYVNEPSFVVNPNGKDEDDGVLLSAVFDADRGASYLLILDARTMKAINTAYMPTYIPFGFHGKFFSRQ